MPEAQIALKSNEAVKVNRDPWIVFEPISGMEAAGFIFYPGGRVLAEAGHLAILLPMPLNLAILNPDAANAIIDGYPGIKRWAIGGHSLGGVMAARYANHHPEKVHGLVLMAAFPESGVDLSEAKLAVASIYGELDGLARVDEVEVSFDRLPPNSDNVLIVGGNHAQFGWYGAQIGDNSAEISHQEQHEQVIQATLAILQKASKQIKLVLD